MIVAVSIGLTLLILGLFSCVVCAWISGWDVSVDAEAYALAAVFSAAAAIVGGVTLAVCALVWFLSNVHWG